MFVLFNETAAKNRRNGARGGRAFACNLRLRKLLAPPPSPSPLPEPAPETVHEASLLLDRQFPWLAEAFAPRRKHPDADDFGMPPAVVTVTPGE